MSYKVNNIDLLREQVDLNGDLISKLERMEAQYEADRHEISRLNSMNTELRMGLNALNQEIAETRRKLTNTLDDRDLLLHHVASDRKKFAFEIKDSKKFATEKDLLTATILRKTAEIEDLRRKLTSSNSSIKQQKMDFEEAIGALKPELLAHKQLNDTLHVEIAALGNDSATRKNEIESLKVHITDLTEALNVLSNKLTKAKDERKIALQKLEEKMMNVAVLEEENQNSILLIGDLKAENIKQTSIINTQKSDQKVQSLDITRINDEMHQLVVEINSLKREMNSVQCMLADQVRLRQQERSKYEALLLASDANIQRAVDDSKKRLKVI
jgi:chromosome segregation ATPase